MFKMVGKLQYDPDRGGLRNRVGEKQRTNWWAVVNVSRELTRYYRWLTCKEVPGLRLHAPAFDAHVSLIRGERPRPGTEHLWKKYDGELITMMVNPFVQISDEKNTGKFFFLEVECERMSQIREEFGFPTKWKYHLTIGRTWSIEQIEHQRMCEMKAAA